MFVAVRAASKLMALGESWARAGQRAAGCRGGGMTQLAAWRCCASPPRAPLHRADERCVVLQFFV